MCENCGKVSDEKMQELVTFMVEETNRTQEKIKQAKDDMASAFIAKAQKLDLPVEAIDYAGLAAAVKLGKISPDEALIMGLGLVSDKLRII